MHLFRYLAKMFGYNKTSSYILWERKDVRRFSRSVDEKYRLLTTAVLEIFVLQPNLTEFWRRRQ